MFPLTSHKPCITLVCSESGKPLSSQNIQTGRKEVTPKTIMSLSKERIAELMAKKRTKGQYEDLLHILMESDEAGVDVQEQWPLELSAKNATALYQGFRNAAEKLEILDDLDILQRDEHVMILVKSRVALMFGDDTDITSDEDTDSEATVEDSEVVIATAPVTA